MGIGSVKDFLVRIQERPGEVLILFRNGRRGASHKAFMLRCGNLFIRTNF